LLKAESEGMESLNKSEEEEYDEEIEVEPFL